MPKFALNGVVMAMFIAAVACAGMRESADIRGTITQLDRIEGCKDVLGQVLVDGAKDASTQIDRARVAVTPRTRLYIIRGGEREVAVFGDLRVGQQVEAHFSGPLLESYPVQAQAAEITILKP